TLLRSSVERAFDHGACLINGHPGDVAALRRPPAPSAVFTGTLTMFQLLGFTETARTYTSRPVRRREGSEVLRPLEVHGAAIVSSSGPQDGVRGGQDQGRTASYTTISLLSPLQIRWSAVASCRTYPARSAVRCDAMRYSRVRRGGRSERVLVR